MLLTRPILLTNEKIDTTDDPFTESRELIGGFSIFNVASKEEALEEAVEGGIGVLSRGAAGAD